MTDQSRAPRWGRRGPIAAVLVALAVALVGWGMGGDGNGGRDDGDVAPVAATSDASRLGALAELVAVSDLVVRAEVVGTERGRVFGDPGSNIAIESRVVTLEIARVLHGAGAADGAHLLVEEEGWTADGAPLVVDGAEPSRPGDDAIWFLQRVGTDEEARYVVVSAEGRYLALGDRLTGAVGDDPLIAELAALGAAGLEAAILAVP